MTTLPDDVAAALDSATRGLAPEAAEAVRTYVAAMHRQKAEDVPQDVQRMAAHLVAGTIHAALGSPFGADRDVARAVAASNAIDGAAVRLLCGLSLASYYAGRDAGYMAGLLASALDAPPATVAGAGE